MELADISIDTSNVDWGNVLQHWSWLLKKQPEFSIWIVTKFGEILTIDDDDAVWFMSTSGASYEKVANSKEEFCDRIQDQTEADFYFMPYIVQRLTRTGLTLGEDQCYGFITPAVFKECKFEPGNFKVTNLSEYIIGLGDMLGKLVNTPNGQKVQYHVVS